VGAILVAERLPAAWAQAACPLDLFMQTQANGEQAQGIVEIQGVETARNPARFRCSLARAERRERARGTSSQGLCDADAF